MLILPGKTGRQASRTRPDPLAPLIAGAAVYFDASAPAAARTTNRAQFVPRNDDITQSPWGSEGVTPGAPGLITETATTGVHRVNSQGLSGGLYAFAVEARQVTGSRFLVVGGFWSATRWGYVVVNLSTRTHVINQDSIQTFITAVSVTATGDGWTRVSFVFNSPLDGYRFRAGLSDVASPAAGTNWPTYAGDGTSAIEIRNPHVERASLGAFIPNPTPGILYVGGATTSVVGDPVAALRSLAPSETWAGADADTRRPALRSGPARIDFDGVDDRLFISLAASLGSACTIGTCVSGVTTWQDAQTVAAGARQLPTSDWTAHAIWPRPLTADEKAVVAARWGAIA